MAAIRLQDAAVKAAGAAVESGDAADQHERDNVDVDEPKKPGGTADEDEDDDEAAAADATAADRAA
jgi:hypothetical protein